MRPLTIGVDVDDVTLDLISEWLDRYNRTYNDSLTPADITTWDIDTLVKPECGRRIYTFLHDTDLYVGMPPVPGAVEGITALRSAGHRVVFVSTCPGMTQHGKVGRLMGLGVLDQSRAEEDFIATRDKGLVRLDVLIDDGAHNIEAAVRNGTFGILFDREHNAAWTLPGEGTSWVRAHSWSDVPFILKAFQLRQSAKEATVKPPADRAALMEAGGHKDDAGKVCRGALVPPHSLRLVFEHYGYGARKYADDQYMGGMSYRRVADAMMRHLLSWLEGEDLDPESPDGKRPHMAAIAWGALTLMEYQRVYPELDDRWPKVVEHWQAKRLEKQGAGASPAGAGTPEGTGAGDGGMTGGEAAPGRTREAA